MGEMFHSMEKCRAAQHRRVERSPRSSTLSGDRLQGLAARLGPMQALSSLDCSTRSPQHCTGTSGYVAPGGGGPRAGRGTQVLDGERMCALDSCSHLPG